MFVLCSFVALIDCDCFFGKMFKSFSINFFLENLSKREAKLPYVQQMEDCITMTH